MSITYELTETDYIQFNVHHIEDSPSQKKMYWILLYVLPLICSVVIYSIGTALFNQSYLYWSIIAIAFFIFWVIYYPTQHKKLILKQTKKLLSEGDNSSLFGEKTLTVREDVITINGENGHEQLKSGTIKKIKQYDDMLLLYNSSVSAIIIPTRSLTETEIDYVKNLIKIKS